MMMMMNESLPSAGPQVSAATMLGHHHYESPPLPPLYEPQAGPPKPQLLFKMPRVVPDQKSKFDSDELFRRLARESEVRYTGYKDRPQEERRHKFLAHCRDGHLEIAFLSTGTNLQLTFTPAPTGYSSDVDFAKDPGKVHLKSHFIMNGVCVRWRGTLDVERLDGVGCLEYDENRAAIEDDILRDELKRYQTRLTEFQDKQRPFKAFTGARREVRADSGAMDTGI